MKINDQTAVCITYVFGFFATPVFFVIAGLIRVYINLIELVMDSSMIIPNLVNQVKEKRDMM
jgi:hypothetical protein